MKLQPLTVTAGRLHAATRNPQTPRCDPADRTGHFPMIHPHKTTLA